MSHQNFNWYLNQKDNATFKSKYRRLSNGYAQKVLKLLYDIAWDSIKNTRKWITVAPNILHFETWSGDSRGIWLSKNYYKHCAAYQELMRNQINSLLSSSSTGANKSWRVMGGFFAMATHAGRCGEMADAAIYWLIRGLGEAIKKYREINAVYQFGAANSVELKTYKHNLAEFGLLESQSLKKILGNAGLNIIQIREIVKLSHWYVDPWLYRHPVAVVDINSRSRYYKEAGYLSSPIRQRYDARLSQKKLVFNSAPQNRVVFKKAYPEYMGINTVGGGKAALIRDYRGLVGQIPVSTALLDQCVLKSNGSPKSITYNKLMEYLQSELFSFVDGNDLGLQKEMIRYTMNLEDWRRRRANLAKRFQQSIERYRKIVMSVDLSEDGGWDKEEKFISLKKTSKTDLKEHNRKTDEVNRECVAQFNEKQKWGRATLRNPPTVISMEDLFDKLNSN